MSETGRKTPYLSASGGLEIKRVKLTRKRFIFNYEYSALSEELLKGGILLL